MLIKKFKVAVTGSIGSGKSTFCNFITEAGFNVIKADDISKKILKEDEDVRKKVIREFGKDSFINKEINKKFLAEKIFSDAINVARINSILHPKVKREVEQLIQEELKKNHLVFVEAALIYEAEMENMFDYVVLITAVSSVREKRIVTSGKLNNEEFRKRDENQIKDEEKKKRADFIFENNGNTKELKQKANLLIKILEGLGSKTNNK
jgi:dephospho-CoA kinase